MKVFVTGATGFIGKRLIERLISQDITVHALYRNASKIFEGDEKKIHWFQGDVCDRQSIDAAMKGCRFVFHLAAYAKVWSKHKDTYYNTIFRGTINVLDSAIVHQVEKVVITSTAGVFGPSVNTEMVDETQVRKHDYFSPYEKYKDLTDIYCIENYTDRINYCTVCPTRVYGPGELSDSNAVTKLIKLYSEGKFHFLPGNGKAVGNYVYIDDVVNGILQALQKGKRGERYILGGENVSFLDLFGQISLQSGKKYRLFRLPPFLLLTTSRIMQALAWLFRLPPLITPGWVRRYLHDWYISSEKAKTELGYHPVSLRTGIRKTLVWILSEGENKKQF